MQIGKNNITRQWQELPSQNLGISIYRQSYGVSIEIIKVDELFIINENIFGHIYNREGPIRITYKDGLKTYVRCNSSGAADSIDIILSEIF